MTTNFDEIIEALDEDDQEGLWQVAKVLKRSHKLQGDSAFTFPDTAFFEAGLVEDEVIKLICNLHKNNILKAGKVLSFSSTRPLSFFETVENNPKGLFRGDNSWIELNVPLFDIFFEALQNKLRPEALDFYLPKSMSANTYNKICIVVEKIREDIEIGDNNSAYLDEDDIEDVPFNEVVRIINKLEKSGVVKKVETHYSNKINTFKSGKDDEDYEYPADAIQLQINRRLFYGLVKYLLSAKPESLIDNLSNEEKLIKAQLMAKQALTNFSKDNREIPKFPKKIPSGTVWENIILAFTPDGRLVIQVGNSRHETNFLELGLTGHGSKPSVLWSFLRVLAELNGEITITDPQAKTQYKKQKEQITNFLQKYFSIDSDPFYPYNVNKSYRARFKIFNKKN